MILIQKPLGQHQEMVDGESKLVQDTPIVTYEVSEDTGGIHLAFIAPVSQNDKVKHELYFDFNTYKGKIVQVSVHYMILLIMELWKKIFLTVL